MIRLVVADDHPIVREGLKCLVEPYGDIRLVGEAIDGHDALTKARELRPDVLLRDVSMPGPHVLEVLGQPGSVTPTVAVLVLSVHPERLYAVRALRTGAAGYLTKDRSAEDLIGAIIAERQDREHLSGAAVQEGPLRVARRPRAI